uniref:Uncharacterized protein n=1 Tax=Knipowitschia caucasica TaxID=637954 RepID=A0AAV2JCH3_KNICA
MSPSPATALQLSTVRGPAELRLRTREASKYSSRSRRRGRLLSFLVGQAKMAVYVSRRRMVQDQGEISPRALLVRMVQARLRLEFGLYRINGDQEGFEERWGFREREVRKQQSQFVV